MSGARWSSPFNPAPRWGYKGWRMEGGRLSTTVDVKQNRGAWIAACRRDIKDGRRTAKGTVAASYTGVHSVGMQMHGWSVCWTTECTSRAVNPTPSYIQLMSEALQQLSRDCWHFSPPHQQDQPELLGFINVLCSLELQRPWAQLLRSEAPVVPIGGAECYNQQT